ncbi:MAG TPA: hypothetical protein P5013_07560 [Methanoregula sp.]|nr:hypothetical protein [Methanoregula sp.]
MAGYLSSVYLFSGREVAMDPPPFFSGMQDNPAIILFRISRPRGDLFLMIPA